MKIVGPRGGEIPTMGHWAKLHSKIHWKKGRSAYSVADFILNRNGVEHLRSRLSYVLEEEVAICLITPEREVRFDSHGKGRVHDLGLECVVGGKESLFVGFEAKVDEPFDSTIQDRYRRAENELEKNPRSKALERVKELPRRFSGNMTIDSMLDIPYQLVQGTAGTVAARQANGEPFDLYAFYVLVFKTSLYNEEAGEENHRDYLQFINRVGGSKLEHPDVEPHLISVDKRPLTCIYEHIEMSGSTS